MQFEISGFWWGNFGHPLLLSIYCYMRTLLICVCNKHGLNFRVATSVLRIFALFWVYQIAPLFFSAGKMGHFIIHFTSDYSQLSTIRASIIRGSLLYAVFGAKMLYAQLFWGFYTDFKINVAAQFCL